jgi:hypothetical protein
MFKIYDMKHFYLLPFLLLSVLVHAQKDTLSRVPFDGMDLTWINGQNRQSNFPLTFTDHKTGETILTGVAYVDSYFNYNFANPIDNTQTISSSIGRHNEFALNLASIGIETNYKNIIGRVWLQYGQMASVVQDLDGSVLRGRNTSITNLKNFREGAAGYRFNKWYGLNIEMGIFMSYIGLESYLLQENWNYQRSIVCEFTPFYFTGARVQIFPTKNLRTEIWLLNGWQTYNSWSKSIGIGSSNYYRPNENIQFVANFYLGRDTRNSNRLRFHHDNSVVKRYYTNKLSKGVSQAAFSINSHFGFQEGDGIAFGEQYMAGISVANRLWFKQNKLALSLRGDCITNPSGYLAFVPSPVTPNAFTDAFISNPNQKVNLFQGTATFDVMPNDYMTFRFEYVFRLANVPYYAGHGGTTSPDGWIDTPTDHWKPDLRKTENRLTIVANFRL